MNDAYDKLVDVPDCEIVVISVEGAAYYLHRGEEHLNQLLLSDGDIPLPVQCLNFQSMIDVRVTLGEEVNLAQCWSIHPAIIARLRDSDSLVELDL